MLSHNLRKCSLELKRWFIRNDRPMKLYRFNNKFPELYGQRLLAHSVGSRPQQFAQMLTPQVLTGAQKMIYLKWSDHEVVPLRQQVSRTVRTTLVSTFRWVKATSVVRIERNALSERTKLLVEGNKPWVTRLSGYRRCRWRLSHIIRVRDRNLCWDNRSRNCCCRRRCCHWRCHCCSRTTLRRCIWVARRNFCLFLMLRVGYCLLFFFGLLFDNHLGTRSKYGSQLLQRFWSSVINVVFYHTANIARVEYFYFLCRRCVCRHEIWSLYRSW